MLISIQLVLVKKVSMTDTSQPQTIFFIVLILSNQNQSI
jgi:hypothetical protein